LNANCYNGKSKEKLFLLSFASKIHEIRKMAGIYIHIPFCRSACEYCSFHFSTSLKNKNDLLDALCEEISLRNDYLDRLEMESIYFGGGTPSLLEIAEIERIINELHRFFYLSDVREITLEANPEDLNKEYLKALHKIGFNRISIGIQSFQEADLQYLGRIHDSRKAKLAIENTLASGFDNISTDLIYAIPGQKIQMLRDNLNIIKNYEITHFSAYALSVEEKSILEYKIRKKGKSKPDEDILREHFYTLKDFAESNDYQHYEISNFCRKGSEGIHNSNYWKGKKYLGFGPSAHSFNGNERQWNLAVNQKYIEGVLRGEGYFNKEILTEKDKFNEAIMLGLRTSMGIDKKFLEALSDNKERHALQNRITGYIKNALMKEEGDRLILTPEGFLFSDKIISDLFILNYSLQ
jgi:oxygen-independent coproporphyrinogen III oxidase